MTAKEKIKALKEKMSKMKKALVLGTLLSGATIGANASENTPANDKKIDTVGVNAAKDSLNVNSSYDDFTKQINDDFDKFNENINKDFDNFVENMGQEGQLQFITQAEERSDQTDINSLLAEQEALRKNKETKPDTKVVKNKAPTAAPKYIERNLEFDSKQAGLIADALTMKEVIDNGRISPAKKLANTQTGIIRAAQVKAGQISMAKALGDVKQLHYEGGLSVLSYGGRYTRIMRNGQADQIGVLHPSSMKDLKRLKLITPVSRSR